jgi:hypothetical protein
MADDMSDAEFIDYPLHDARVEGAELSWDEGQLRLRLHVFFDLTDNASPATLTFSGLLELATTMKRPWGTAAATTILDQRRDEGGVYVLELQSGDEVRVVAASALLERA